MSCIARVRVKAWRFSGTSSIVVLHSVEKKRRGWKQQRTDRLQFDGDKGIAT